MASEDDGGTSETTAPVEAPFNFADHGDRAAERYRPVRGLYEEFAEALSSILRVALREEAIKVQAIDPRGKSEDSFREKAEKPLDDDANRPKYPDPLRDITDLAGVRVIVFLEHDVNEVGKLVERVFGVQERLQVEAASGYTGLHLIVALRENRDRLLEYQRFAGRLAEIQVRTVLQHAWAEIEHGIGYKPTVPLPLAIRVQLRNLSGTLGTADHGLQEVALRVEGEQFAGEPLPGTPADGTATAGPVEPAPSVGSGEGGVGQPTPSDPVQ